MKRRGIEAVAFSLSSETTSCWKQLKEDFSAMAIAGGTTNPGICVWIRSS